MKEENFNKHITTTHKELFSPLLFRSQRSNGTASNGHHHHNGTANGHSNGHINGGSSSSRRPLSAVNNGTSSSSSRSSSSAAARAAKMANGHSNTLSVNGKNMQGSAKRWFPGCVNSAGRARQKW